MAGFYVLLQTTVFYTSTQMPNFQVQVPQTTHKEKKFKFGKSTPTKASTPCLNSNQSRYLLLKII